jgi:PAS domain S-box-containing protein
MSVKKANKPEILIVDDEEANRLLFSSVLDELNITCDLAETGMKCLDMLKEKKYALILLDIKMPGLNGFEVLDIIRNKMRLDVPVILISAIFNTTYDIINGIEKGAMDFIPKPVELSILKHKVSNIVRLYEKNEALNDSIEALESLSKKLQERENRIRKITDAVSDAIIVIDPQGTILFWNRTARKVLGYSKIEIINENILDTIIAERSIDEVTSILSANPKEFLSIKPEQTHFIYARNKLGLELPFELTVTTYKKEKTQPQYVLVLRDLTKYIRMEKEVEKAKELREANKVMREFVDNVSHEMRTPMNAILGISKMLIKYNSKNLSEKQLEGLEIIKDSGTRLLDLINDVLDLSKIESNNIKVRPEPFHFYKFLAMLRSLTYNLIGNKEIKFIVRKSPGVPNHIIADQKKLHQILLNLVGNSVKFTEKGRIILTTHVINDNLHFEVVDTGIGISKEDINTIFGKFKQIDNSVSKKYKGTGLGLHISKKLIELMGGKISVESVLGKGTAIRFFIRLPQQDEPIVEKNELQPNNNIEILSYSSNQQLLILIDDNPQNAFVYYNILEVNQYSLLYCSDGKTGLKAISRFKPDTVIIKLEMSDIHGLSIIDEIVDKYPKMKITAISEYDERPAKLQKRVQFISEPINDKILIDMLREIGTKHDTSHDEYVICHKEKSWISETFHNDTIHYTDIENIELAYIELEQSNPGKIIIEKGLSLFEIEQTLEMIRIARIDNCREVIFENYQNIPIDIKKIAIDQKEIKLLDKINIEKLLTRNIS